MNAEKQELALLGLALEARWSTLGGDCTAFLQAQKAEGPVLGLHATM